MADGVGVRRNLSGFLAVKMKEMKENRIDEKDERDKSIERD